MIATFFSVNDLQKESGSWAFMYNFDQYFYQDKKDPTSRPSKCEVTALQRLPPGYAWCTTINGT